MESVSQLSSSTSSSFFVNSVSGRSATKLKQKKSQEGKVYSMEGERNGEKEMDMDMVHMYIDCDLIDLYLFVMYLTQHGVYAADIPSPRTGRRTWRSVVVCCRQYTSVDVQPSRMAEWFERAAATAETDAAC